MNARPRVTLPPSLLPPRLKIEWDEGEVQEAREFLKSIGAQNPTECPECPECLEGMKDSVSPADAP